MSDAVLYRREEIAPGRPYIERLEREAPLHDRVAETLLARCVDPLRQSLRDPSHALKAILAHVARHEAAMRTEGDDALRRRAVDLRPALRRDGFTPARVGEAFALVRETSARILGRRHYDAQLLAGWGLLQGRLVEMQTGEGKTMSATLPAATVALAGHPVHVITVNDYLAQRDSEEMGPLYRFLGLDTGAVIQGMERPDRRAAYRRAVTYCSNKELAFDYLRDRVALSHRGSRLHLAMDRLVKGRRRDEDLVLRGLGFAIVDEADSVFIDEARTPLILSASVASDDQREVCEAALAFASELVPGRHYALHMAERLVRLLPAGKELADDHFADHDGVWTNDRARDELITQALSALLLFRRDQQYVVTDGKVQIVDESTGRVMPDRSWERGLHQMIEVKENCEITSRRETLARLTYQRLLRRYVRLSGMTGTASEVAGEIRAVYGLHVVRIPLHRPSRRRDLGARVVATRAQKWQAVAASVERIVHEGRPVLIGTRSVRDSEEISAVLNARRIAHALLNAKQDKEEAGIVACAGEAGRVTVATNMAGRGTDIRLGEGVTERGGLHVILTEYHESRRIDRQLYGRCARQGDPGSCEAIVSVEDDFFSVHLPGVASAVARLATRAGGMPPLVLAGLRRLIQSRAERRSASIRRATMTEDKRLEKLLAFSGRGE